MAKLSNPFLATIPMLMFLIITVVCGALYAAVQQDQRLSANDPQIQMSEDGAAKLARGGSPAALAGGDAVDMAHSLAPFVVVYDRDGKPVAGNGYLDGKLPQPPHGVFDYTLTHHQDRFTWQPAEGVRAATVVTAYNDGYVLAARSMREVEQREYHTHLIALFAWIAAVGCLALAVLAARK